MDCMNLQNQRRKKLPCWALILACAAAPATSFFVMPCRHRSTTYVWASVSQDQETVDLLEAEDSWLSSLQLASNPNVSRIFTEEPEWEDFLKSLRNKDSPVTNDPLWEQIKLEAVEALGPEPEAGPQVYQGILSQPSLLEAVVTIIANEISTESLSATELKILFLQMLTPKDEILIHLDIMAITMRSPSVGNAMMATLFHRGLHALVCYRVGHRLWLAGRIGLAYYLQSTVSRKYSADIHPACIMGAGLYLNTGGGVVIGETAVVGQDVRIFQGVTLGGTGKEAGDRHPKVGNGVILGDSATVLGNIPVGDGAVVMAKSIVTKPVPPLARVSGVPARIVSYRDLTDKDDLGRFFTVKYMEQWQELRSDESNI